MDELKPCPFCGSMNVEAKVREHDAWIFCKDCGGKGGLFGMSKKDIQEHCLCKAVELWNRRAEE